MKKTITLVLFLGIVAAISGLCISLVNDITSPLITENEIASEKTNLELMFPGATFEPIDYTGDDESILGLYEVVDTGYVVKVEGYGYSTTPIVALIGFDHDITVLDVIILSNQETNGYVIRCYFNFNCYEKYD